MTATARFTRVAVALALGVTAPLLLHVDAQAAPAAPELATVAESAATPTPAHRARSVVTDTSARRDRGHSERAPVAPRRRTPRAKSGASSAPAPGPGGQYVPDQPWETEFFVDNTLPTRHYVFRLASLDWK